LRAALPQLAAGVPGVEGSGSRYLGPLLFLFGQQSPYAPTAAKLHELEKFYKGARTDIQWLPGGHYAHVEMPKPFLEKVTTFLRSLG